jgi:7,8-dihydropterin-6-yl-methyl-4-(beta-D-ribofuranosyl)aminobenzene 5'-phosphate synthase
VTKITVTKDYGDSLLNGSVRGFSRDILDPDAAPCAQALSRLLEAAQEARVVFEPIIERQEGHAFTTGAVPRTGIEHVLPNTWAEIGIKDGLGCDAHACMNHHFTDDELAGKPQPDQHWHERATCFRLGDRRLVVISSCGHAGIINTLRRVQEVTGVEKIYALVGSFHLAPALEDYLRQVMAELKKFDLDHVLPMHCSGRNFIDLAEHEMAEKLVLCTTGSRFTFTT